MSVAHKQPWAPDMAPGDTTHDAVVAREIGVDCVLVSAGHHPHDKLLQTGARVVRQLAHIMSARINGTILPQPVE
jgi:hypothetical protein